jgi:endonuclease VIII-like 1
MPELAELRLTADFINHSSNSIKFTDIQKNHVHKCLDVITEFDFFKISAESRGKELMLTLKDLNSTKVMSLSMSMGMSGHFAYTKKGKEHKHAHLNFFTSNDNVLSFVDVRRFGKWKLAENWASNRGPDPTTEFDLFKENIIGNINKPIFNKPIYLIMMNQQYFSGIGNYLRAEILYRLNIHPNTNARTALTSYPEILDLCKTIPLQAYALGGGQLKDWENPFKNEVEPFRKFMRCYGNSNMNKFKDSNGRMFWYDPKWTF